MLQEVLKRQNVFEKKKPMEEEESMGCSGGWLVVTSVQWAKH